jgi:hypothetical protein
MNNVFNRIHIVINKSTNASKTTKAIAAYKKYITTNYRASFPEELFDISYELLVPIVETHM